MDSSSSSLSPGLASRFWTLSDWSRAYATGGRASELVGALVASLEAGDTAWISRIDANAWIDRVAELERIPASSRTPLYGVPFAVKDNIDAAGFDTTCACPAFAYRPAQSASAVERLERAGAIVVGKTNLDQFATGLVGTRSPYGIVANAFDERYIAGGSSSGSASVVARGLVPFALGTDTAGSGRVPAGHLNLVGMKPTRGLVPTRGVVPACRTLDCVSVFALSVDDAASVLEAVAGFDAEDPWSREPAETAPRTWPARPRLGLPAEPPWFGDDAARTAHAEALRRLERMGATLVPIDARPLLETAALLYEGPWVAERYAMLEPLLRSQPEAIHPVVRSVVEKGVSFSAADAFRGRYRLAELKRAADAMLGGLDGLVVPTSPGIVTIEAALADPIGLNARMGTHTNFVNLLDWSAIAVPAGLRSDGLPAGITLIAPAWHEGALLAFARAWQAHAPWPRGASDRALPPSDSVPTAQARTPVAPEVVAIARADAWPDAASADLSRRVTLAVVGAHLAGLPLNGQLVERGATLVEAARTSADYRLFALPGTVPAKPGLLRTGDGAPIAVELWSMPVGQYGSFVALVPAPLAIGTLELEDGRRVQGFVCEAHAAQGALDITSYGGWRAYLRETSAARAAPG